MSANESERRKAYGNSRREDGATGVGLLEQHSGEMKTVDIGCDGNTLLDGT